MKNKSARRLASIGFAVLGIFAAASSGHADELQKLLAAGVVANDLFGYSVAVDGDIAGERSVAGAVVDQGVAQNRVVAARIHRMRVPPRDGRAQGPKAHHGARPRRRKGLLAAKGGRGGSRRNRIKSPCGYFPGLLKKRQFMRAIFVKHI